MPLRSLLVTCTSAVVVSTISNGDAVSPPAFKPFNKNLSILKDQKKYPVIIFLHGTGKNDGDISNLADPQGAYGGWLPSLLATNAGEVQQVLVP
jgi:hypothetical protein